MIQERIQYTLEPYTGLVMGNLQSADSIAPIRNRCHGLRTDGSPSTLTLSLEC